MIIQLKLRLLSMLYKFSPKLQFSCRKSFLFEKTLSKNSLTISKYSARTIFFTAAIIVLLFCLISQTQLATARELTLIEDGSKVNKKSLVLSKGWASEGYYTALKNNANYYISMKLCPSYWWWQSDNSDKPHTEYKKHISREYKKIEEYVPYEKCKLSKIFDQGRKLYFTREFIADNFIKRYTPITLFLPDKDDSVKVIRGTIEYESAETGRQTISAYSKNGIEICQGSQEIFTGKKGEFYLSCFNDSLILKGFTELRDYVFGTTHTVGSGVTNYSNTFAFVSNLIGEKLNDKYSDIEIKNSMQEIVEVLLKTNSDDNREKNSKPKRSQR